MPEHSPHILVADDERSIRLTLETGLALNGFRVTCARSGREALEAMRGAHFDAIVSDIFMPDGNGLEIVKELRAISPGIPIILITAQGSVELAVRAVAEGASDFIAKPFEIAALSALVRRHLDARRETEQGGMHEETTFLEELSHSGIVGRSAAMVSVYKLIAHAARTDATVLVLGESGTGKELVARAIHDFSPRAGKPFVAVNCAGLTDTLLEAELFGHTRGAFTGATADRAGLFEAADNGTLFLDELASTSGAFQASLLRALQLGEVRRVGSTEARHVNVRVIGASNAPLYELVAAGTFRTDLFYRLSVLTIELPPLRERTGDVELLARHFLRRSMSDKTGASFRLSNEAVDALNAYSFPGNVRELENAIRRA
ncbi:MAG TPA: sigma-54 dependent transcriptional regulator, partial [Pyrinomonadaceae bacterium]